MSAGPDSDIVTAARAFAIAAHGEQTYGHGAQALPYVTHLDEVAGVLRELAAPAGDVELAAAYLHDVVEDTGTTTAAIEATFASFGADVAARLAAIAGFCTDEPGLNRKQRKGATYARMRRDVAAAPGWIGSAVQVKLADRIANLRTCHRDNSSMLEMYRRESASFREALYVAGMCEPMWAEHDRLT
jgi:guanosine-3',5'-bis(diphosphate) 3'-pyrophosphohydrolase